MAAKRSDENLSRTTEPGVSLLAGNAVEVNSNVELHRHEVLVDLSGEPELGPGSFPSVGEEPGFAVRFRQRLLEAGTEYSGLLGAAGDVRGRLAILVEVAGQTAESWYQDVDQWMFEAARKAFDSSNLSGESASTPTGIVVRANFQARIDEKLLALNEKIGKDAESTGVSTCMSESFEKGLQSLLRDLAGNPVADYTTLAPRFMAATHTFRTGLAALLEGPLNDHLQTLPQETPAEKQALASWLNAQLRQLGLAVRCPKTGRPSVLISDLKESGSHIGRFRSENRDETGAKVRPWTSTQLPVLELMEDLPRLEPLVDWTLRSRNETRRKR